jgi:hypothetical protein
MFIIAACLNTPATYTTACNKAVDAGTRQVGIRQEADKYEDLTTKFADHEAQSLIGKKGVSVVGATVFIYKTTSEKKLKVDIPNFGICDQVSTELATDSQTLRLIWNFK